MLTPNTRWRNAEDSKDRLAKMDDDVYMQVCLKGRQEGKLVGIASHTLEEANKVSEQILKGDNCKRVAIVKQVKVWTR